MLSKLLKHEFKDTTRIIPFLYLAALIFSLITLTAIKSGIVWLRIISSALIVFIGIAVIIVTIVIVIMRFYKNLYSNEGYLMFTLPVKPHMLLISKCMAAFCWIAASMAVFFGEFTFGLYGMGMNFNIFSKVINDLDRYGFKNAIYLIIPLVILSILFIIGEIYFSITVANRPAFHQMGIASAFLIFFVTYIVLKIVESVATIFIPFSLQISTVGSIHASLTTNSMLGYLLDSIRGMQPTTVVIGLGGYVLDIIVLCILYISTGYMMNRKVSIR